MCQYYCPNCGFQLSQMSSVVFGNVRIDPPGQISLHSQAVDLPPTQFILADALIRAQGRGVYRSTLANLIGADVNDQSVTVYIRRLRESFRKFDPTFKQIECLKGFGAYRWIEGPYH